MGGCHRCGMQLPDDARFCLTCGARQGEEPPTPAPASHQGATGVEPTAMESLPGEARESASTLNRVLAVILGVVGVLIAGAVVAWIFLPRAARPTAPEPSEAAVTPEATRLDEPTEEPRLDVPTWTVALPPTATLKPTIAKEPTEPATPTDTPTPSGTPTPTPLPHSPRDTGGRIVFTRKGTAADTQSEIWVLDVASGALTQVTDNNDVDHIPSWSPDGAQIAFTSNRGDNYDIYVMNPDGSGQQLLIGLPAWDEYARWSPDGGRIAFVTTDQVDGVWNSEVFIATIGGGRQRVTFNQGKDEWPTWSPDGGWLACSSDRDGDWDVYVFRTDGSAITNWSDDTMASVQPAWSPDGEWIAFARQEPVGETQQLGDIWIGRRDRSEFHQLTPDGYALGPAWSPDGRYIVYSRYWDSTGDGKIDLNDAADLMGIAVDGLGRPYVLTQGREQDTSPQWAK